MRTLALLSPVLLLLLCGFSVKSRRPQAPAIETPVIVTAAPVFEPQAALARVDGERFPQGAHLLLVSGGKAEALAPDFAASADANVSFDGKSVLFAGRKNTGETWKVWEMKLADRSVRLVASGEADLVRPLYLPGGRVVYARRGVHGFGLEAASLDGSETLALTHIQAAALPVDVLQDGRVLFEAGFPLGSWGKPELYLVYSDGSGVESVRCDHGAIGAGRWGGHQLASGDVVFTHGRTLARFTSPLAVETPVTAPAVEYAGPIAEAASGDWLASTRRGGGRFALTLVKAGSAVLRPYYADAANHLVEPTLVAPRATPKRHPTALHDWTTANLLALDVRISREGVLAQAPPLVRVEEQDADGRVVTVGTSPVEADGSFYVKVSGDKPVRFALMDAAGRVVRAERGWFWIRAGEQRICVGCHAGPERAPENRVPQVLLRTTLPVDLTKQADGKGSAGSR